MSCQNRITRAAVEAVNRSKLEKAASSPWLELALRPSLAPMMARAVGHPQPADLQRIRIGSGRSPPIRRSITSIGTAQSSDSATAVADRSARASNAESRW